MVPIVIIQTSHIAFDKCSKGLKTTDLIEGTDFMIVNDAEAAEEHIVTEEPQLLVTGTFHGNEEPARAFVREMKRKNPKLTAAIFSTVEIGGEPFDSLIKKVQIDDIEKLVVEIKKFLGR